MSLGEFANSLLQEIRASAEAQSCSTHDAFVQYAMERLDVDGAIEDWTVAYFRAHGLEVSGYAYSEATNTLDIIIAQFEESPAPVKIGKAELTTLAKRAINYCAKVIGGLAAELDETTEAFEMATVVSDHLSSADSLRILILTNDQSTVRMLDSVELDEARTFAVEIWDLVRFERLESSGKDREPVYVQFDPPLPCLTAEDTDRDYSVLVAVLPGEVLAEVYKKYGPRLLERNVRSFLSTKGKVNSGIRETLRFSPERFLAYNNGITATADRIELTADGRGISAISDFQIVNGGQTTASLHSALVKDKADLARVRVQMKLSVVKDPEKLPEIVREISRFSNTQNKVQASNFSANHPFHVEVEKISRTLWAPAAPGSGQEIKWFYERSRGQYADELFRAGTAAKQKAFKIQYPQKQRFTKTDLAKWENSWAQFPWLVSRGAEKNFLAYMQLLDSGDAKVDQTYFTRLIAKGILFKQAEAVVTEQNFGGYRANIVTYTIAKLAHATSQCIDLDRIWRDQYLSDALKSDIAQLSRLVCAVIMAPPKGTSHVGEWTKKEACWVAVDAIDWEPSVALKGELVDPTRKGTDLVRKAGKGDATWTPEGTKALDAVKSMSGAEWFALSRWAAETKNLQSWQRRIAFSLGRLLQGGKEPSQKQAVQGEKILNEALRLGFKPAE